jgi:ABC-type polysaccharide/polyol phosphate transport system ATPase subunit
MQGMRLFSLVVTHDVGSVRAMCKRCIVVIDHHEKVFDGSVEEGTDRYLKVVHEREAQ